MSATVNFSTQKSLGPEKIIAGLDIGTTKVSIVIARVKDKMCDVLGVATASGQSLRKGVVINMDATVEAIKKAKEEAELMAGNKIDRAWISVAGNHVKSFNSKGMVAIKSGEVSKDDLKRVLEAAQAVAMPEDRQILHVLPQSYAVDSQEGIRQPLGMSGVRLEAGAHVVTGLKMSLHNIVKCAERAGLHSSGLVLEPLAASESCLSSDEKDLGVVLVEMGGGSCDILIYVNGSVVHTAVLPIGGNHLTHDISVGLRTPAADAEQIKKTYGCAMASLVDADETIEIPSVGGRNPRTVSRTMLCEVIEPRAEETLQLIYNEIIKSGYQDYIGAGVVLTGGASQLEGLVELGEFLFEMPVRRGGAHNTSGLSEVVRTPSYATAVGLVKFAIENSNLETEKKPASFADKIRNRVSEFLDGAF